jgi:predicted transcriptional regulator of viral defense system
MSSTAHLAALLRLGVPAVTTADVAAVLGLSVSAASQAMRRLAAAGLVQGVRKGLWSLRLPPDPMQLLEYVTAPYPAYVSLQSALFLHGMVDQIPAMTFAVTLGRGGRVATSVGTYSLHHVEAGFFDGFEVLSSGVKVATPEKALVDMFYLSATRTRSFATLPEIELPRRFRVQRARGWVERILTPRLREVASRRLEALLARFG